MKDFTKTFMNKQKMKRITKEPITWLIIFWFSKIEALQKAQNVPYLIVDESDSPLSNRISWYIDNVLNTSYRYIISTGLVTVIDTLAMTDFCTLKVQIYPAI